LIKVDLHTHTNNSIDSIISPESLARKAMQLGIIPAITDHNKLSNDRSRISVSDWSALATNGPQNDASFCRSGFRFISGEEIRTDKGDLIGLYLNEEIPKNTPALEAIDIIHGQGGLAYLPHMFDVTRSGISNHEIAKKADIIEVFNARSVSGGFNKKAEVFAKQNGLAGAAGSDSHFLFEFGSTYTELPDFDIGNPKELMKALPRAKIVGKPAPFFVRGTTSIVKFWKKIFQ